MTEHAHLLRADATVKDALVFALNYFRNAVIHGRGFQVRDFDDWSKAVLCFQSKGREYEVGYDALAVCFHLLPIVLVRLMEVT